MFLGIMIILFSLGFLMRINNKKDLPKWFSLDAYDVFSRLDDAALIKQITYRVFGPIDGYDSDESYYENVIKDSFGKSVKPQPLDIDKATVRPTFINFYEPHNSHGPHQKIAGDRVVSPLRATDVYYMYEILERQNSIPSKEHERDIGSRLGDSSYDILKGGDVFNNIHCVIDLGIDDEFILSSIKEILPIWRKQMNVSPGFGGECPIKTSWPVNRQKLISYNAFAFYDLMRWQHVTNNKITNSVLAATLYPNGEYGEMAITQTIKDYVEKIFTINYIGSLIKKHKVKKNR